MPGEALAPQTDFTVAIHSEDGHEARTVTRFEAPEVSR
jgi:hypothetical protein